MTQPSSKKLTPTAPDADAIFELDTPADSAVTHKAQFLPAGTEMSDQGVWYRADADGPYTSIITTPLWLAGVVRQGDTGETHLRLEWCAFGGAIETVTMPNSYLGDKRALSTFLYQHNISGFSVNKVANVSEYLRASLMRYNAEHPPTVGYSRFGWSKDGFVIGSEIVTAKGILPAHVVRVPQEIKDGLTAHGDVDPWVDITSSLDDPKYWTLCFTLQAILGSPLLKLLNADSAILSIAGESGTGKTTIAEFGISAFGKPKSLEVAPQSTEKAFQEKWRIANNLPILCNEAATIDPKKINNIVYAAANGEPRDTLTQRVELRATNKWTTLTVFTSNSHLQGLDDQQLNEAGRRRILELTIDTSLDGALARSINEVMREHYGHVGRTFLSYVVANQAEVTEQLKDAYEWCMSRGILPEDRFSSWIIATAKVAGEIASNLGLLLFDVVGPCDRAIDAARSQSREITSPHERVDEVITDFINAHHDHFSTYRVDGRGEWITTEARAGEVVGRYTIENKQIVLALAIGAFTTWARTRGVDSKQISNYVKAKGIASKGVKLVPYGKNTRCLIVEVANDKPFQLAHVASIPLNARDTNNSTQ